MSHVHFNSTSALIALCRGGMVSRCGLTTARRHCTIRSVPSNPTTSPAHRRPGNAPMQPVARATQGGDSHSGGAVPPLRSSEAPHWAPPSDLSGHVCSSLLVGPKIDPVSRGCYPEPARVAGTAVLTRYEVQRRGIPFPDAGLFYGIFSRDWQVQRELNSLIQYLTSQVH